MTDEIFYDDLDIMGNIPRKENEIAISDDIFLQLGLEEKDIGTQIYLDDNVVSIVGVVNTSTYGKSEYMNEHKKNCIYVNELYIEYIKEHKDMILVKGGDIKYSSTLNMFAEFKSEYSNVEILKNENLVRGRMPIEKNEIVVSRAYFERIGTEKTGFKIPNLYEDKFYNVNYDAINLYDIMGDNVEIVGVADVDIAEIFVNEEVYQSLKEEYYSYYIFDEFAVLDNDNINNIVASINEVGLSFTNEDLSNIYAISDMLEEIKIYYYIIQLVLIVLTCFLSISFLSYSVKDNSKKIGILRSIGVTKIDTIRIFIIEAVVIALISGVISASATIVFLKEIDTFLVNRIGIEFINKMIYLDAYLIIGVLVGILILFILVTLIPILKFAKKKPIDVIRG